MTPEAQRIAIAKACGLTVISDGITHHLTPCILGTGKFDPAGKGLTQVPDYLNDLNAMHEAEKVLFVRNDWSRCDYEQTLKAMTSSWCWHATAPQRAEAFLRTLNLWIDS